MNNKDNIEIEFKSQLSKEEYGTIKNYYKENFLKDDSNKTTSRVVHYFDTENMDFLNNGETFRIVFNNEQADAVMETKKKVKILFKDCLKETSKTITRDKFVEYKRDGIDYDGSKLVYQTVIWNTRLSFPFLNGEAFLDMVLFANGKEEYELEFEVQDVEDGQSEFNALLEKFKLTLVPVSSKYSRAIKNRA